MNIVYNTHIHTQEENRKAKASESNEFIIIMESQL